MNQDETPVSDPAPVPDPPKEETQEMANSDQEKKWIKWALLAPLSILMWYVVVLLGVTFWAATWGDWPRDQQPALLELTKTVLSGGVLAGIVAGLTLAFKTETRGLLDRLGTRGKTGGAAAGGEVA